eukprot:scaffold242722_cov17-Prasinocladus_malaysianus.AAC.1
MTTLDTSGLGLGGARPIRSTAHEPSEQAQQGSPLMEANLQYMHPKELVANVIKAFTEPKPILKEGMRAIMLHAKQMMEKNPQHSSEP